MNIFCTKHDKSFQQRPSAHLQGQGCPECGKEDSNKNLRLPQEVFIQRCKNLYGEYYDYSEVKYSTAHSDVEIVCPVHGKFFVKPNNFLHSAYGCSLCAKEKKRLHFQKEFIRKVTEDVRYLHMDFKEAVYVNNSSKVKVFCKTHSNWFTATPNNLLDSRGVSGCKVCAGLAQNRWSISALLKIPNIKETKGYLYTGTISNLDGVKIGITGDVGSRMTGYRTDLKKYKDVSFTFKNTLETTYFKAAIMETIVKRVFKEFHITHSLDFGGKSEIYDTCCESLVRDLMGGKWDTQIDHLSDVVSGSRSKELTDFVKELKEVYIK